MFCKYLCNSAILYIAATSLNKQSLLIFVMLAKHTEILLPNNTATSLSIFKYMTVGTTWDVCLSANLVGGSQTKWHNQMILKNLLLRYGLSSCKFPKWVAPHAE